MGSDSKRKRRESEGLHEDEAAASERKKARKAAKAAAAATAAAAAQAGTDDILPGSTDDVPASANEVPALVSPIASPMAGKKLTKKLYRLVSSATKAKALRRGIKEVVLALRKGDKGICVLAGDVFPIEVIAHVPLLCEEAGVPYCYVPRKSELGIAALTKRPTSVALVSSKATDKEVVADLEKCRTELATFQTLY